MTAILSTTRVSNPRLRDRERWVWRGGSRLVICNRGIRWTGEGRVGSPGLAAASFARAEIRFHPVLFLGVRHDLVHDVDRRDLVCVGIVGPWPRCHARPAFCRAIQGLNGVVKKLRRWRFAAAGERFAGVVGCCATGGCAAGMAGGKGEGFIGRLTAIACGRLFGSIWGCGAGAATACWL